MWSQVEVVISIKKSSRLWLGPLQWRGFDPWPRNFGMQQIWPKRKKRRKKGKKKKKKKKKKKRGAEDMVK